MFVSPRHDLQPPPGDADVDHALLTLRDGKLPERMAVFPWLKRAGREKARERMAIVRPWNPEADGLQQAEIASLPAPSHRIRKNCIVFVASSDYLELLHAAIDSIQSHGNRDAQIVVLYTGVDYALESMGSISDKGAVVVWIRALSENRQWIKTAQLLIPRAFEAENYLMLEADTLVLTDLAPLWELMNACPANMIFGVAPNNPYHTNPMEYHLNFMGGAGAEDARFICGREKTNARFLFNGGVFAGKRAAIETLNTNLASLWPFSQLWIEGISKRYGEEVMMNWAASMPNLDFIGLDASMNTQYAEDYAHLGKPKIINRGVGASVEMYGRRAKILHVLGSRSLAGDGRPFFWAAKKALESEGLPMRKVLLDALYRGIDPFSTWKNPSGKGPNLDWIWTGMTPEIFGKSIAKVSEPINLIVEVGSFKGGSAVVMADVLKERGIHAQIIAIDTFLGDVNMRLDRHGEMDWLAMEGGHSTLYDQFMSNVLFRQHQGLILPFACSSTVALRVLAELGFRCQIAYLDSAHEKGEVLLELRLLAAIMPPGGILLLDDWNDSWPAVKSDVAEFVKEGGHRFEEVGDRRHGIIVLAG